MSGKIESISEGTKQQEWCKDVVKAFAASNIPLSKLDVGSPLRALFDKYMHVDGEWPAVALVNAKDLLGTWLPKVHSEGCWLFLDVVMFWLYCT